MKTSNKFYVLTLLVIPFLSWAGFYWYATAIEQASLDFPKDEVIQNIKKVDDLEAIKFLLISELETSHDTYKREVSAYYSYAEVLLSLAMLNAVLLFMLYRSISQKGSNKSSNLTGEKDSPSS